jgi:hypothetical protein
LRKITIRVGAALTVVLFALGLNVGTAQAQPSVPTAPPGVTVEVCSVVRFFDFIIFEYDCERRQY